MSHVAGHIIDPPRSDGSLRPLQNDQPCSDLVIRVRGSNSAGHPINHGHFKNQKVGFHPKIDSKTGYVWADDLVIWEAHEEAEETVLADATYSGLSSLEDIHDKPQLIAQLRRDANGKFAVYKDTIIKTIDYITTKDFKEIYLDKNNLVRQPHHVVDKIREQILYP